MLLGSFYWLHLSKLTWVLVCEEFAWYVVCLCDMFCFSSHLVCRTLSACCCKAYIHLRLPNKLKPLLFIYFVFTNFLRLFLRFQVLYFCCCVLYITLISMLLLLLALLLILVILLVHLCLSVNLYAFPHVLSRFIAFKSKDWA